MTHKRIQKSTRTHARKHTHTPMLPEFESLDGVAVTVLQTISRSMGPRSRLRKIALFFLFWPLIAVQMGKIKKLCIPGTSENVDMEALYPLSAQK